MDRAATDPAQDAPQIRWDFWLPLAGGLVAAALLVLAVLADRALDERRELALEGRYLRLAHQVEVELREAGPEAADAVLEGFVAERSETVRSLAILAPDGTPSVSAGEAPTAENRSRDIDLFLGHLWAMGGSAHGGMRGPGGRRGPGWRTTDHPGIRTLRLVEAPGVWRRPVAERLLLPASAFAGLAVVALAALGGHLLRRQQEDAGREATRRRLEGLGRAGAGLAHQLRTPLATLKGSCQLLAEDAAPSDARVLSRAIGAAERMENLLGQLLDYAKPPTPEPTDISLVPLWRELGAARPRLRIAAGDAATVHADPEHLQQVLENLLDNALESSPEDTEVELGAARRGPWVEIRVEDRGPGPGDDPEHLFEPYVTGRAAGTGLGLPIARSLAEAGGGRLHLEKRAGGGTRAVLKLPAAEPRR